MPSKLNMPVGNCQITLTFKSVKHNYGHTDAKQVKHASAAIVKLLLLTNPLNTKRSRKMLVNSIESTSGQSYKASTIIIFDSTVVPDLKIPHIMTIDS